MKNREMQNLIESFKKFNNEHKKLAPFLIYFEMAAIFIATLLNNIRKHFVLFAVIMLAVIAAVLLITKEPLKKTETETGTQPVTEQLAAEKEAEIVATEDVTGTATEIVNETVTENVAETATEIVNETVSENVNETVAETKVSEEKTVTEAADNSEVTGDIPADEQIEKEADVVKETQSETVTFAEGKENIAGFMGTYPETVGWIWFEDERLSYPIMQAEDNSKYAIKDYEGNDSDTGALFLDYRSSADFSDPNSIIYGHNMRNRSMFGALKIYKENLGFLKDHKYFQIITPEGRTRYMIFAFMDVKKDSYIYDVCGTSPDNMRSFLDTIEYKTYIDTGIEPSVDDKIITLSTCTKTDDLYFVMFAVKVD